jgi:heat shock protein HslJ
MFRYAKLIVPVLLAVIVLAACKTPPTFSDAVMNKDWELTEARVKPADIFFNRKTLTKEGFSEIFTLRFEAERVSGIAAPNRYSAPYTLEGKHSVSIQPAISTQMAPLHEPEKLKEHEFFIYLHNTYEWNISRGNLELYSKSKDGAKVVLTFSPAKK